MSARASDKATGQLFPAGPLPQWCLSGSPLAPKVSPDDFGGPGVSQKDAKRFAGQLGLVARLMDDGRWRTLAAIAARTGSSEAGASARLRDLRKARWGSRKVDRRRCHRSGWSARYEYRLVPAGRRL